MECAARTLGEYSFTGVHVGKVIAIALLTTYEFPA